MAAGLTYYIFIFRYRKIICFFDFSKKEDWNAIVRQNTVVRDPIGSTRASINRKDRLSLRRHILEKANKGLNIDTNQLIGILTRKFYKYV